MDSNSVDKFVPGPNHGDAAETRMDEVVTGLSGVVITQGDKQRYALDLLKNVTEDDMITAKDLGLHIEPDDTSLPDLDASLAGNGVTSFDGDEHDEHVIGTVTSAEIVGSPPVKVSDDLIEASASKVFENYTTASLRKKITTGRKQMDAVAGQYFEVFDELKRLRSMYLDFAVQHRSLVQELNIRDTLQIQDKLPRPLTDEQVDLLRGMKLKVLRSRKIKVPAPVVKQEKSYEEQEDQQFQETSFDMLKESEYEARNKLDLSKYDVAILHTKQVRCELCGKTFNTKDGLQSHLNSHSGHFFQCEWCPDKKYTAIKAFKKHLKFHAEGDKMWFCSEAGCGKRFENKQQLDSHSKCHTPPTLRCRVHKKCKALFKHSKERKRHELSPIDNLYLCDVCFKGYKSKSGLERHQNSHKASATPQSAPPTDETPKKKRKLSDE